MTTPHGIRLKCQVVSVRKGPKGAQVTLSRTHPDLVRNLFKMEAPKLQTELSRSWALRVRRVIDPRLLCAQRSTM